jgi:heme-degrading monooxygenase HmoA
MSSVSEDIKLKGGGPVTFINVFEVAVEQIDTFITQWRERAKIMSTALGFLDSRLHRALSSWTRFQVLNVAHWDSRLAWEPPRRTRSQSPPACSGRRHRSADLRELKALHHQVVAGYGDHEQA